MVSGGNTSSIQMIDAENTDLNSMLSDISSCLSHLETRERPTSRGPERHFIPNWSEETLLLEVNQRPLVAIRKSELYIGDPGSAFERQIHSASEVHSGHRPISELKPKWQNDPHLTLSTSGVHILPLLLLRLLVTDHDIILCIL
ncbi:hypothetical protein NPIL_606571 [Nephila pilipes]|uniref:Uncharacterized protein n=1 Tax=Nephila pilipes TaxID=299642 RepID=A0A8X6NUE9_NEPPI|nr:hypothetical protein NPIL_606571 [Nephila pilipes]